MKSRAATWTWWRAGSVLVLLALTLIIPACGSSSSDPASGPDPVIGGGGSLSEENSDGNLDPKSGIVATVLADPGETGATNIAEYIKARVDEYAKGNLPPGVEFPLANSGTDTIRVIQGLKANLLVKWLDPLTFNVNTAYLTNDAVGVAGNQGLAETVGATGFRITGMAGGTVALPATGSIRTVSGNLIVDGQTFTIKDGTNTVVFEFDKPATAAPVGIPVAILDTDTAGQVARKMVNAINGVGAGLTVSAATDPVFGSHCDYVAYFGDGWDAVAGTPPQWNGSGTSAWLWVNHEYVTPDTINNHPAVGLAPAGQPLVLAKWLKDQGVFTHDLNDPLAWTQPLVNTYLREYKKHLGGSWIHIIQDPSTGAWSLDRTAPNKRYDATSNTLTKLTGQTLNIDDVDDLGVTLPVGVCVGILADCSGGQSPWGTIFTAEENFQDYYGDLESCWNSTNQFVNNQGFNPGLAVTPTFTPSLTSELGASTDPFTAHQRDVYGYLVEIDPNRPTNEFYNKTPASGEGNRKMGAFGRARWENCSFVTDNTWKLTPGQPIVIYGNEDRRGGRVWKWVSGAPYTAGMTKAQIRALLDTGNLYVSHFQGISNADGFKMSATSAPPTDLAPGTGKWILLSTTNATDDAPNAPILGAGTKVGAALMNNSWNNIGGFPADNDVRRALFTAAEKIGIFEMNRPEDVEWNPIDRQVYIALTNFASSTPPALGPNAALGEVTLKNDANGIAGNVALAEGVANAGFRILGMSGGSATAPATGAIVALPGASIVDGETYTIGDGTNTVVFEFDSGGGVTLGIASPFLVTDSAQQVATKMVAAINGVGAGLTVTANVPASRTDRVGRIWTMKEANQANPALSTTFTFWEVWGGVLGAGVFDAANVDNLVVDKQGGLWFGTDGNFATNGRADAYYYLDLNPAHKTGGPKVVNPSFGKAFRFLACPSDAEATGPCLSSDMKTFFSSIQHPGEGIFSTWP